MSTPDGETMEELIERLLGPAAAETRRRDLAARRADFRADVDEQLAVVNHNHRWLVRLRLIPRRPMPDPLWPRCYPGFD